MSSLTLQLIEAKQLLVDAVSAANNDAMDDAVAILQQTMANVCIRKGLKPLTDSGYQLLPIDVSRFGQDDAYRSAKAATKFAKQKLRHLTYCRDIKGFVLCSGKSETVYMDITELIPNPSAEVRSLLPTVIWPEPAASSSSSSDFLSPSRNDNTSAQAQPSNDQQLDAVISMLDLLPSEVITAIEQQLGLRAYAHAHHSISR